MLKHIILLTICISVSGCSMSTKTGADWDGSTSGNTELVFIASYADSVHLKSVNLTIPAGQSATAIAALLESKWNADGVAMGYRPASDESVFCFPRNVTDMKIMDQSMVVHDVTAASESLPNGVSIRKRTGSVCDAE